MSLEWKGDEITRKLERAQRDAINELAGEMKDEVRKAVPVRSGRLKRSAKVVKAKRQRSGLGTYANPSARGWSGGVKLAFYGLLGRNRRKVKAIERKAQGKLADRIAKHFRSGR